MPNLPDLIIHPMAPRPIALRQHAGIPELLASVLVVQRHTAMALGVLGPYGDVAAAELLRRIHARLGADAHALAGLLEVAGPIPAPATIEDRS